MLQKNAVSVSNGYLPDTHAHSKKVARSKGAMEPTGWKREAAQDVSAECVTLPALPLLPSARSGEACACGKQKSGTLRPVPLRQSKKATLSL